MAPAPKTTPAAILAAAERVCRDTPVPSDGVPLPILRLVADALGVSYHTVHRVMSRHSLRAAVAEVITRHGHVVHPGLAQLARADAADAAAINACASRMPTCVGGP